MASSARQITTGGPAPAGRDDAWLIDRLNRVWADYFWDVPRKAPVRIAFGAADPDRLGCIRWDAAAGQSAIEVNGRLREWAYPEAVLLITIAHELAHYAQGQGSCLPRRGGDTDPEQIVERELDARGLAAVRRAAARWLEQHWSGG